MSIVRLDVIGPRPSLPRVYTPDSPIRRPIPFARELVRDVRAARILAWRLFVRDTSALYRQTAFGYLWAILPALVTTLVWILLNHSQFVSIKTGNIPYPVFVLTGTIFWQLFLDALNAPLKQLVGNKSMLNRVNFPTEALLMSGIAQVLFSFVFKVIVLAVALALFRVRVEWTTIFILLPTLGLLVIGTVVGVLLLPIGLLYKDIEQALLVLVMPLMFLTPVVYPAPSSGLIRTLIRHNPLTPLFNLTRGLLFGGAEPSLVPALLVLGTTLVVAAAGWVVYRLSLPILVERLEA